MATGLEVSSHHRQVSSRAPHRSSGRRPRFHSISCRKAPASQHATRQTFPCHGRTALPASSNARQEPEVDVEGLLHSLSQVISLRSAVRTSDYRTYREAEQRCTLQIPCPPTRRDPLYFIYLISMIYLSSCLNPFLNPIDLP